MLHVTALLNGWISRAPVIHKGNLITSYFSRHHILPPCLIMHDVSRTNSWNVQRAVNMRTGFGEVISFSRVCFWVLFKSYSKFWTWIGIRMWNVRCIYFCISFVYRQIKVTEVIELFTAMSAINMDWFI
jgi:hypothetical protein